MNSPLFEAVLAGCLAFITTLFVGTTDDAILSPVWIGRILISAVIAASIGYFVWWLQTRTTRKRIAVDTLEKERLARDLRVVEEERERIATGHKELELRVKNSEQLLASFREQLGLMEQAAQPLFEAAKRRLIESLTHPSEEFKVPDELLQLTLSPEGYITPELAVLLKERETSSHPEVTPEEKLAAALLPNVVELAAIEARTVGPITSQLVSSPVAEEKGK